MIVKSTTKTQGVHALTIVIVQCVPVLCLGITRILVNLTLETLFNQRTKHLVWVVSPLNSTLESFHSTYRTPCVDRVYDALPPESRIGRVRLLVPARNTSATGGGSSAPGHPDMPSITSPAAVIHLAATGDQGFGRRLHLAFPLLKHVGVFARHC